MKPLQAVRGADHGRIGARQRPEQQETDQIVAFFDPLTGAAPPVLYPVLPPETATTPRPTAEIK